MFAGLLSEVIEIYRCTKTRNDFGEEELTWKFSSKTRAEVSHSSTSRTVIEHEIQFPYSKYFVVRKYVDVQEDDRIKYNGKYYTITSIEFNRERQCKKITVDVLNE